MAQVQQSISSSDIGDVLEKSLSGIKLEKDDCIRMLRSPDVHLMGMVAGHLTQKLYGKRASFVNNIILNYTNVCITDCKFCAFYRPPGHDEAYTLTLEQIESRVKTAWDMFGIRQVLIQGGHNADLPLEYYEDAFKMMRSKYPLVGIHGLSASELDIISKVEKSSTKEILSRLKDAGLQSVPGAGAEILVDSVKILKKLKAPIGSKLEIGLPSSAHSILVEDLHYGSSLYEHLMPNISHAVLTLDSICSFTRLECMPHRVLEDGKTRRIYNQLCRRLYNLR